MQRSFEREMVGLAALSWKIHSDALLLSCRLIGRGTILTQTGGPHVQDDEAHVFVGVNMQQAPQSSDRRGSLLVRRSIVAANAPDEAETSSSSGAWQPQDSILEVEPSPGSAPGVRRK